MVKSGSYAELAFMLTLGGHTIAWSGFSWSGHAVGQGVEERGGRIASNLAATLAAAASQILKK